MWMRFSRSTGIPGDAARPVLKPSQSLIGKSTGVWVAGARSFSIDIAHFGIHELRDIEHAFADVRGDARRGFQNPPQGPSLGWNGWEESSAITTEKPLDRSIEYWNRTSRVGIPSDGFRFGRMTWSPRDSDLPRVLPKQGEPSEGGPSTVPDQPLPGVPGGRHRGYCQLE